MPPPTYNAARQRTLSGSSRLHGYLATITSLQEQHFIYDSIAKQPGWMAGVRVTLVSGSGKKINEVTTFNGTETISG